MSLFLVYKINVVLGVNTWICKKRIELVTLGELMIHSTY